MVEAFRKTNVLGIAALCFLIVSCAGKDGATGPTGPAGETGAAGPAGESGPAGTSCTVSDNGDGTKTISCEDGTSVVVSDGADVDPGTLADIQSQLEKLASTEPESCAVCHKGAGDEHQAVYNRYTDATTLQMTIDDVTSVADGNGGFNVTMTVTILKSGVPFLDGSGLPTLEQKRFTGVEYDSATRTFHDQFTFSNPVALGNGQYTVTASGIAYAPESSNALVYGYIADSKIDTPTGGRVTLYDDVASAGRTFGDAGSYESASTVSGCEKCHGVPYGKHGYRQAKVAGLPDFASCKACHADTVDGSHFDWQILVDDPARFAEIHEGADFTTAEEAKYAYKASIMNDVHMSHAMEFPYPQSMANCVTCHEGKLDVILADSNFKVETCKSCHPVDGSDQYGTSDRALVNLMPSGHDVAWDCSNCHHAGGNAPVFSEIHAGYDKQIFASEGMRYSDLFTVSIDSATYDSTTNVLNVKFSATENSDSTVALEASDIVPTLMVGLYGYDTKDFLVSPHSRDSNNKRLLEYVVNGQDDNPRFTTVSAANASWEINVDLSMWSAIIGDTVRRAEIAVEPGLTDADGVKLALNAPSRTFDLTANGFDDGFYPDIVDVQGCNKCHEALATTFHSADRGGNIRVCRLCHVTSSGGSHLEMQSRSIDSYVHAIHSFQAFDPGDVDFTDPVEKARYELHIEHTYPVFTTLDCRSCHNPGTFDVPDQSKSLPGVLSGSDAVAGRNIGTVPAMVTGPATRACGGCHRAELINEDDANGLAAFYSHTKSGGYMVENETGVWEALVQTIMSIFE